MEYLTFDLLSNVPGLVHGFFTRHGGVSSKPYDSLNVSWNNGDSPQAVRENLARVSGALGIGRLVSGLQVHGDTLNVVGNGPIPEADGGPPLLVAPQGDALATNLGGIGLLIKVADCQAIFLVDPETRVIANIHSGWRGSVQNIAGKVVVRLQEHFGCDPGRMLAAVGPSLGPCCAEFRNFRDEIPPDLWDYQVRPEYFDFWAITRRQLADAGIRPENMEFARRCTVCGAADFFSYRGEHSPGRMAAVIGWKEDDRKA